MIILLPIQHFDAHWMRSRPAFFNAPKGGLKAVFLALDADTMARRMLGRGMHIVKGKAA